MTEAIVDGQTGAERESAERFWHLGRGLGAAVVLVTFILVFTIAVRETNYDIRLDAAYGRATASGSPAAIDDFSPTRAEGPSSGWLWWLVSYVLVSALGTGAVRVFAALLVALGFVTLLAALSRRVSVVVAGLLIAAAAWLSASYFVPGSQAVGVFLFSALAALVLTNLGSSGRRMWWAPLLMLLYVNSDISWPAGVAVCLAGGLAAALSRAPRKWEKAGALLVAIAATAANPDFVAAWGIIPALRSPVARLWPILVPVTYAKGILLTLLVIAAISTFLSRSIEAFVLALGAVLIAIWGPVAATFAIFAVAVLGAIAAALGPLVGRLPTLAGGKAGDFIGNWVKPILLPGGEDTEGGENAQPRDWQRLRALYGLSALLAGVALVAMLAVLARKAGELRGSPGAVRPAPDKAVAFLVETLDGAGRGVCLTDPFWAGLVLWEVGNVHAAPASSPAAGPGEDLGRCTLSVFASTRPFAVVGRAALTAAWAFHGVPWPSWEDRNPLEIMANRGVDVILAPVQWNRADAFRRGWKVVYWDDTAAVLLRETEHFSAVIERNDQSLTYPPFFLYSATPDNIARIREQLFAKLENQGELAYAHYGLAVCAFVERNYDLAEGHVLFALGIKDDLATAWHLGADVYRIKGEEAKAVEYYTQAIRYNMDNAMAFLQLGNLLINRGDWVPGLKSLRSAQMVDDRRPQLDRIRPGLRAELDEQVKKMLSPQPHSETPPAPGEQRPTEVEGPAAKDEGVEREGSAPPL